MTTKNIQDVVAEKIEMIVDLCIDQLLGGYDIRVEDPHRLQLFKDQLELKLTTTLTQLLKEVEAGERERLVRLNKKIGINILTEDVDLNKLVI